LAKSTTETKINIYFLQRSPTFDGEEEWRVHDSEIILKVVSLHSTFSAVNILLGPIKLFKFGSRINI